MSRGRHATLETTQVPGIVHGKHSSYTYYGCRCDQCRATHLEYMRTYDTSKDARGTRWASIVDTAEARRKLLVLSALGWSGSEVAEATGVPHETLYRLRSGTTRRSNQRTIDGINAGHTRLTSNTPGIRRREKSDEALGPAVKRAYVPVQDAERLIQLILDRRGYPLDTLAKMAGVTAKTLYRIGCHQVQRVSDDTMTALEEVAHREGIHV